MEKNKNEKIPAVFPAIDNDLAIENFTNDFDMTAADLQDLSQESRKPFNI